MIIVHHLEDSRSQRVLWCLEELGVDYDIKHYKRDAATRLAPESLKKVHPLGKSPVIEDRGQIIAETGAIIEYIADTYGRGAMKPDAAAPGYRDYIYWMHFAEGSLMPQLLLKLFFTRIKETKMPFFAKPIAAGIANKVLKSYVDPNLKTQMSFINSQLADRAWFAGDDLTGADIMMSFPLEAAQARGALGGFSAINAYVDKFHERPAYQRALSRGGPYSLS